MITRQEDIKQTSGIEIEFRLEHATDYTKLCKGVLYCTPDTCVQPFQSSLLR